MSETLTYKMLIMYSHQSHLVAWVRNNQAMILNNTHAHSSVQNFLRNVKYSLLQLLQHRRSTLDSKFSYSTHLFKLLHKVITINFYSQKLGRIFININFSIYCETMAHHT